MGMGTIRKVHDKMLNPNGEEVDPMANDPFINTYIGGKGGYPQQPSYQSSYIDPYSQPFRQSPINNPYAGAFQPFTGSYGYQQPMYSPPPQFYSPPQQYFSPYMNQFQMAGSQFYQQPYSPQPYFQQGPFMQPGGRQQYFAQRSMDMPSSYSRPYTYDLFSPSSQPLSTSSFIGGKGQR